MHVSAWQCRKVKDMAGQCVIMPERAEDRTRQCKTPQDNEGQCRTERDSAGQGQLRAVEDSAGKGMAMHKWYRKMQDKDS